jgi:hypothetical protein
MSRALAVFYVVWSVSISTGTCAEPAAVPTAGNASGFQAGFASRDVTPQKPAPMWGYGARHDRLSEGILDPLYAKAIVLQAGNDRLAIVGLDLGRGPTKPMMETIRKEIEEKAGIRHVLISGSHTHHGPVIELVDQEGFGKGKFDDAVAYAERLPGLIVEAILEAAKNLEPARLGIATKNVTLNRNRHTKQTPKATDPMLAVLRFDNAEGKPLAILVNFAAHPVTTDAKILKFSADYPGFMMNRVEAALETKCVFMQGASGDMSANPQEGKSGPKGFGEDLGDQVVELAKSVQTAVPPKPSLVGKVDTFHFRTRIDFANPTVSERFQAAFFPELVRNFFRELQQGIEPELSTVILNRDLALVGGSGEFFCNHANRLKQRSYVPNTLFFGYCNGHHMYFPTIEAVSEQGYGADPAVSPVEIGAGERMMDQALINIYTFLGRFAPDIK